ncbi:anaerobic ribonucleoside-triphosphate reductase activating protein [Eisenbergiella tayi]|uniref:anaerobic ribonucleoside-triphosphate reductase activating protein n=1 Tax=Eisenbergiella tayi TaxID=1432052 RepID=UPI0008487B61|nr:anaerobic ribonucleoside-triphosphate reductase activating protein [Eisenbergiella tayi]ODR43585.1 anaerobic ribonucleoside-triphosphate reductase activating protein [Eisenbergiella tayi]
MQIFGFNKTTLLDFPEHVACTVFTGGCNFRCPFCQNGDLVLHGGSLPVLDEEEVFGVLRKRKGILTGVCVTGGEPTLQRDLDVFLSRVKELRYLVKLDSNGYRPEVLQSLCERGLVDYFAMDIKSSPENYARTAGVKELDMGLIRESVDFIRSCGLDYEFRTTVVRELHSSGDFLSIGEWLKGCKAYFLQSYVESEGVICKEFSSYSKEELEEFVMLLKPYIDNVSLRGVD